MPVIIRLFTPKGSHAALVDEFLSKSFITADFKFNPKTEYTIKRIQILKTEEGMKQKGTKLLIDAEINNK